MKKDITKHLKFIYDASKVLNMTMDNIMKIIESDSVIEYFDIYDWNDNRFKEQLENGKEIFDSIIKYINKYMNRNKDLFIKRALYNDLLSFLGHKTNKMITNSLLTYMSCIDLFDPLLPIGDVIKMISEKRSMENVINDDKLFNVFMQIAKGKEQYNENSFIIEKGIYGMLEVFKKKNRIKTNSNKMSDIFKKFDK